MVDSLNRERRFTALLRLLHLHGGVMYEEKMPRCLPALPARAAGDSVGGPGGLRAVGRGGGGPRQPRPGQGQVRVSARGLEWLRERDCLTFGWEESRHGFRQPDADFSALILKGELP